MQVSPYLSFDGQCEAAFKFYEKCLHGKIESMMPYEGSPMADEVPAEWGNKVMHGEFRLGVGEASPGENRILMGADCMPDHYEAAKGTSIMISMDDPAEAERAFNALSENGKVTMAMQETFWAAKFGTFVDQFGIPWMINCEKPG